MGLLSTGTNNADPTTEAQCGQVVALQTLHQHFSLCSHRLSRVHAVEHQVPQVGPVPDRLARPLGGRRVLARPLLCDIVCHHVPLEAKSKQPALRIHTPAGRRR